MKGNSVAWLRGLTAILAFFFIVMTAATSTMCLYEDAVNAYLNGTTTSSLEEADTDTIYVKSEFGDYNDTNVAKLIAAVNEQTVHEMEEGAVLLTNELCDDNKPALPLGEEERAITIFGLSSVNPVIHCRSAGNTAEGDGLVTMGEAFAAKNFRINTTVWDAYGGEVSKQVQDLTRERNEKPASFYTQEIKKSWENDYNDVAILFFARESGEGNDFSMADEDGMSQLALHANERALVEMVTSDPHFKKVIAILNVPTSMEAGWLEEYGVDACLWIGAPGQSGFTGMVNILTGKVSPSGHLVDVYATNSLSAPAVVNSGTNSLTWSNLDAMKAAIKSDANSNHYAFYTPQPEGIYVGYKYYETRYEDTVLGTGNADVAKGSSDGNAWDYTKEVSFSFGHGLSYTEFTQTLGEVADNDDGTMSVSVTVKNTGDTAGKSVVQLYAQTPYGEYEKTNLVEKSAVQLVAFGKTETLYPETEADETHPNEQTLTLTVDKYLLASYDYKLEKGYILSAGDYYLAIGADAHDALNNILAAKGKTVADGMDADGDETKVYSWDMAFDNGAYAKSVTGYEVTNRFDDCDLNYWTEGSVTYLTRQNWETYPDKLSPIAAPDGLISVIDGRTYQKPADAPAVSSVTTGKKNGISLIDLRGKDFDDPLWDEYLDQMTVDELASQLVDGFSVKAIPSVGKPENVWGDGMDSIGNTYLYGDKEPTGNYTSTVTLVCTWNTQLYTRRGELMGEEALWSGGRYKLHSVGGDLHRTPFGGRNFEYMSEDANLCAFAASCVVEGMQSNNKTNASMKHMTNNDQERYRTGIATFFNEQAFREASLRIYEFPVQNGLHSVMTGLNRIGGTYCPQSRAMLTEVLRNEWGFVGATVSDADSATYGNVAECLAAGLDTFCYDFGGISESKAKSLVGAGDGYMLQCLREAVKRNHYLAVNSGAMNGVGHVVQEQGNSAWKATMIALSTVLGAAFVAALVGFVGVNHGLFEKCKAKKQGGDEQ